MQIALWFSNHFALFSSRLIQNVVCEHTRLLSLRTAASAGWLNRNLWLPPNVITAPTTSRWSLLQSSLKRSYTPLFTFTIATDLIHTQMWCQSPKWVLYWPCASRQGSVTSLLLTVQAVCDKGLRVTTPFWFLISQAEPSGMTKTDKKLIIPRVVLFCSYFDSITIKSFCHTLVYRDMKIATNIRLFPVWILRSDSCDSFLQHTEGWALIIIM